MQKEVVEIREEVVKLREEVVKVVEEVWEEVAERAPDTLDLEMANDHIASASYSHGRT